MSIEEGEVDFHSFLTGLAVILTVATSTWLISVLKEE